MNDADRIVAAWERWLRLSAVVARGPSLRSYALGAVVAMGLLAVGWARLWIR